MDSRAVKIVDGGRIVLPAAFREALGVTVGDTLTVDLAGNELRLRSAKADREAALERLRARLRLLPRSGSVVDELIAERRAEATRE